MAMLRTFLKFEARQTDIIAIVIREAVTPDQGSSNF
jgi:hypothetical protein